MNWKTRHFLKVVFVLLSIPAVAEEGLSEDSLDLLTKLQAFEQATNSEAQATIQKQRDAAIKLLKKIQAAEAAKGNLEGALEINEITQRLAAGKPPTKEEKQDLLPTAMIANGNRNEGEVVLNSSGSVSSLKFIKPPIRLTYEVKLDGNDLRIQYAAQQIIFNWEMNNNDLRIDGGPASNQHRPGKGKVPTGKYIQIVQEVLPGKMSISVDGELRAEWLTNFSTVNSPVRIFNSRQPIAIREMTAETIELE